MLLCLDEILAAFTIPVTCVKHHQPENDQSRIVVHPITGNICPYWLSENVLCLLSNAVKYSDKETPVDLFSSLTSDSAISSGKSRRLVYSLLLVQRVKRLIHRQTTNFIPPGL